MKNATDHKTNILQEMEKELDSEIEDNRFLVFLCGPSINRRTPGANLRRKLFASLEANEFTVMLGEDDGLKKLKEKYTSDAQTNELNFIQYTNCGAIIIIADSVGSYCELGLFNWLFADKGSTIIDKNQISFFVIANEKFKDDESYFIEGPIETLRQENCNIRFCNYKDFDVDNFINFLKPIRTRALSQHMRRQQMR